MSDAERDDDLDLPPGLYTLRPGTADELAAHPPFPVERLGDPDDAFARSLRLVARVGDRVLFALPSLAMLWALERDGWVVAQRALAGQAAARAWIEHGMVLEPALRDRLLAAVRPGVDLDEALVSVFGPARLGISELAGGEARALAIRTSFPYRSAVLEVEVEADGRLRAARLLEGRPAWERLSAAARARAQARGGG